MVRATELHQCTHLTVMCMAAVPSGACAQVPTVLPRHIRRPAQARSTMELHAPAYLTAQIPVMLPCSGIFAFHPQLGLMTWMLCMETTHHQPFI